MERETYIQLDRIEAKLDYIIEWINNEEEYEEDDTPEITKKGQQAIKTSIKDKKSEIIDEEDE